MARLCPPRSWPSLTLQHAYISSDRKKLISIGWSRRRLREYWAGTRMLRICFGHCQILTRRRHGEVDHVSIAERLTALPRRIFAMNSVPSPWCSVVLRVEFLRWLTHTRPAPFIARFTPQPVHIPIDTETEPGVVAPVSFTFLRSPFLDIRSWVGTPIAFSGPLYLRTSQMNPRGADRGQ
jgi:hypothetical protein